MWQLKYFTSRTAMIDWIEAHKSLIQWDELFVDHGYCVEYRTNNRLRI